MVTDTHDHREGLVVAADRGGQDPAAHTIPEASTATASKRRQEHLARFQQRLDEVENALIGLRRARLRELATARRQRAEI